MAVTLAAGSETALLRMIRAWDRPSFADRHRQDPLGHLRPEVEYPFWTSP